MTKAFRILLIALLGLAATVWLGATGVAPAAPVAEVAQVVAPAPPASEVMGGETTVVESGGSYLGVDSQDVTKERMADLKFKEERGVEVLMVDQDAPAGKAGLKEHDVILEFNGAKVESVEQLRRMIHETPPGRTVTLGISRAGQPLTLNATLAERNKEYTFSYSGPKVKMPKVVIPKIEMPEIWLLGGTSRSGLLVDSLTPQLGEFFGVKNGEGVLVRSVEKGSPGEAAGFKAGDIIVRVENEKVADRGDWRSTMRSHRSGKVSIGIIRDKKEQTLSLVLPESKEQSAIWHIEAP
ncbi:MAG: PDZ domain-containing protein, partial [Terriglobales bacterium]